MIGDIRKFKFWCQKVLPLVYDDSLSYYEVLCKLVQYLNKVIEDVNSIPDYIDAVINERLSDEHIQELIEQFVLNIEAAISSNNEGSNTNSNSDYIVGEMLWWKGKLYRVIRNIDAGDTFIPDTNIEIISFDALFNDFIDEIKHDITANDDGTSSTATQNWIAGDWLWLNDVLYKAKTNIDVGSAYITSGDGANVEEITIENTINDLTSIIGNLNELETNDKTHIVTAINEIVDNIGDLSMLHTADKSNVVNAINEALQSGLVVSPKKYGAIGDGVADDTTALQNCINNNANNIILLDGIFKITGTITLVDNTCIKGGVIIDGMPQDFTHGIGETFLFYANNKANITMRDIEFRGNGATQYNYSNGYPHDLIEIDECENVNIIHNYFNCVNAARGVCFHSCSNSHIDYNKFYYARYVAAAIMNHSNSCTISHNVYKELGWSSSPSYALIFSTTDHGGDYATNYCSDIMCCDNIIIYEDTVATWESISAHGANRCIVDNNLLVNCCNGIAAAGENVRAFSCTYCQIKNNTIIGNNNDMSGQSYGSNFGIYMGGYENAIENNSLYNCGNPSGSMTLIGTGGAIALSQFFDRSTIKNNFFFNCKGIQIYFAGSGSSPVGYRNINIAGNTFARMAYGAGGRLLLYINDNAVFNGNINFNNNVVSDLDIAPTITGWNSSASNDKCLVIRDNIFYAAPNYTNPAKIVTDYIDKNNIAVSVLGLPGMVRKVWNAANANDVALQIYTDAWHNIATI